MTTDAKVIPTLVSRRLAAGEEVDEAFRATVASLEGSVAIAASAADRPDRILLALRGSGQALNVGLAEDTFVVASEPYGLVEETATYLRMDGETAADPQRPGATRGQIVTLDAGAAGELTGIRRSAYDGTELPVSADELQHAEITTRDIDRGASPHYLLKEISEAPGSFRKTLRGRIAAGADGRLAVDLGPESLPDDGAGPPGRRDVATRRRDRPGHGRRRRPEPRRRAPGRHRRTCSSTPCRPPSCPASRCVPTCTTRSSSPSARAARRPTRTAPSTSSAPVAPRSWRS